MPGRRALLLVLGAVLGSLFLYLAARSVDWVEFHAAMRRASLVQIGLGAACVFTYYAVKALRWRYLVAPFARARARTLQPAVLAGLAGNYVFPHVGEIARAVLAARRLNAPFGALLGSIAIERFFDFLALLVLVLVVLVPAGTLEADIRAASVATAVLCAVLLAGVAIFILYTEACIGMARRMLAPFSRRLAGSAGYHLRQARMGLAAIREPRLLAPVLALSVAQWLLVLGCIEFSLRSVDVPVAIAGALSVLVLNVIGLTLPAAPGHVGTVQLAFIAGLAPFGVAHGQAFAASLIYNVLMVVPTVILGFPGLRQAGAELRNRLFAR